MAEKIQYVNFRDERKASAAEGRLRELGEVRIDADEDSEGPYWLAIVTTTTEKSPSNAEMEALAEELGGEYDGSETALE
jgi:hypothetical protein